MWAMSGGDENLDILTDLIAHGADLYAKDAHAVTVLGYASADPPRPKLLEAVKAAMAQQEETK